MEDRNDWLRWRRTGIGSSDAPILHGISEYATVHDLFEQKIDTGPIVEQEDNFVTRLGNEMEPKARVRFAALYSIEKMRDEEFAPRKLEMKDLPFMKASLDGASKDLTEIVELKYMSKPPLDTKALTPGQIKHQNVLVETLPTTSANGEDCRVPYAYWMQVQHQLLVSGARVCYFTSFDGESLHHCEIFPDVEFMKLHLAKCAEFWNRVQCLTPPPLTQADYKEVRVKGAKGHIQKWKHLAVLRDEIEGQMADVEDIIIGLSAVLLEKNTRLSLDGVDVSSTPFKMLVLR